MEFLFIFVPVFVHGVSRRCKECLCTWLPPRVSLRHGSSCLSLFLILLALGAAAHATPSISSLSPTSGPVGTAVTISGSGFGSSQGSSTVKVNGTAAAPTKWRSSSITVPVPSGATTGNVVVTVSGSASNGVKFTIVIAPAISSLAPTSGGVGAVVTITGTNFGATQGSSTVKFNGTAATPTSWSATSIKAPVPSGTTTGNVVVKVGGTSSNGVSFTVVVAPSISGLSPTSGPAGTSVTISGSKFGSSQGSSTVKFNGTVATPTSWAAGTIKTPVPAGATTGNVVVMVGGIASNGVNFTVAPKPTISSLSPTSGAVGTVVTISGTNFGATQGGSPVTFKGVTATPTSWSATSIQTPVPSGASTGNVVVTVGGVASTGVSFTVILAPSISSLSPASGAAGTSVTISGSRFGSSQGTSTVTFNGVAGSPTSWSGSKIKVPVPLNATTGNVVVTVNGVASNGVAFTIPSTTPVISNLSPTSGPAGTSVTVTGTNFGSTQGSSTVTFNGVAGVPTSWSATSIRVPVPATATTGNVIVTVAGKASNGASFTVLPTPAISKLAPASAPVGTAVTISGTNFGATQGTSSVAFNGAAATTVTSWSATSILAIVPANASSGNVVVTVSGVASAGVPFTVLPTPSITGLSPSSGTVATSVTITGTNFGATQAGSTVTFNGVTSTPTSWSATSIKAPVPASATTGNVVVTVSGVPSNGASFTVVPTPAITGLSPTSGPVGSSVTITGTNFGSTKGTSTVAFNGAAAGVFTTWTATSVVAAVPAGATTGNVVVTVSGVPSNGSPFTVLATPGITGLTPTAGPIGSSVTITGSNFGASPGTLTFNGTPVGMITSWTAGSIVAAVPVGATTGNVVVTANGVASNGMSFTVLATPNITNLSPTSGVAGTTLTISGANFGASQGGSTVTFNGALATATTSWNDGSIVAAVPAAATTGNVVVTVSGVPSSGTPFTVLATPSITGLSSNSGRVGDPVTITGADFGSSQDTSTVTFNGTAATITTWSAGSIMTTVPGGASTGNVVVTVSGVASSGAGFTVLPPSFAPTSGSLAAARSGHTATRLTDGTVFLSGGTSSSGVLNSAEIYDPASKTFRTSAGSMNSARAEHTATLLNSGLVLIVGGLDATRSASSSAELYDPVAQTFTPTTGALQTARAGHTATLLSTGEVLIVGGYDPASGIIASAELYDPIAQSFTSLGNTNNPRFGHTATLLQNGEVLIAGGKTDLAPSGAYDSAEIYDPVPRQFVALAATLNTAREAHSATLLNSGLVLIAGGELPGTGALSSAELFDPQANTFTALSPVMTAPRAGHTATLLNGGLVLISGGYTGSGSSPAPLNTAEVYDPAGPGFQATGKMTTARMAQTATLLNDGTVLEAGGTDGQNPSNAAELYVTGLLSGLTGITISPLNPSVPLGTQQLFTATGTFSSSSPQILSSILWSASTPGLAVTNDASNAGFAAGVSTGTLTLTASAAGVTGSTAVTVGPPVLVSIALAPQNPSIALGTTQQFAATGTFSDGTTQDITTRVTWSSLAPLIATVNSSGLASTVAPGPAVILASSDSVSTTTLLTVGPATLAIVNSALAPGEAGTAYAATLTATGGAPPYYWSLVGGSLPSGLLLEASSGTISGVTNVAGSYSFTAQVNDSDGQNATLAFDLTVSRRSSAPIVLNGQSGIVIEDVHISSQTGDCVQLIGSSNITIRNSDIGPCAGNAVNISGGDQISVFDSYIHPETQSPACCDHNNGILAVATSNLVIQGNVIAYGETNIEVRAGNTVMVTGNFLLNPRDEQGGIGPRGSNFQCWSQARTGPSCTNVTVENNYALSSLDTAQYLYPEATEDSINFGHTEGMIARNNYITGGHSTSGCGLIADLGANDAQFLSNILIDTGQCGIGIADGTNQLVDSNQVINRNPVDGGGNQAIYVWQGYGTDGLCGPVTVSNNIAVQIKPGGVVAGFWKGVGCDPLTLTNNIFGQPAYDLLTNDSQTPVEQMLPPPLIPPQPKNCVAISPYSTQTAMAACNP